MRVMAGQIRPYQRFRHRVAQIAKLNHPRVEGAVRAYEEGKVDSFVGLPAAALAFQWSAQARYVIDLRVGYLTGCMLVSRRAWDALSHDDRQAIAAAALPARYVITDGPLP